MNYFRIFLLIFTFFIVSCSCIKDKSESQSKGILIDDKLFKKGVLHIEVPESHPSSFAIKSPSEKWFVIQDSSDNIQIMPQFDFDNIRELEFKVKDMKGVTWGNSIKSTEIIFNEPGLYVIYFANNLETEPENTYSLQASVYFLK